MVSRAAWNVFIYKSPFCYKEKRLTAMHGHDTMMKIYEGQAHSFCRCRGRVPLPEAAAFFVSKGDLL